MKHAYPEFYRDCLPSEKGYLYDMGYLSLLPGEDRAGHRLCVCIPGTRTHPSDHPFPIQLLTRNHY